MKKLEFLGASRALCFADHIIKRNGRLLGLRIRQPLYIAFAYLTKAF